VGSTEAQMFKGVELIKPTLICGTQNFSKPFTLGIKFVIAEGWHTYWKNPGDSGIPLDVTIDSASGYRIGEIQYPKPKKFASEGSVSYGYEDSVVFLVRIIPPPSNTSLPKFTMHLKWLVCKSSCIAGKTDILFDPSTLTVQELRMNKAIIDRWTARLPQPGIGFNLENTLTTLLPTKGGYDLKVEFPDMEPGTLTDFYPEVIEGFAVDYSSIQLLPNGFILPLQFENESRRIGNIRGIAIIENQGYDITVKVKQ
jgi:thiol:disulfide interchange protein DsbD